MNPTVYLSGNGNANTVYVNADFDTSDIFGQTLHNNCVSMTWEEFTSRPNRYQVGKIINLLDRVVHADGPHLSVEESLFAEALTIEAQPWFNGHNYPAKYMEKLRGWFKEYLQKHQS